MLVGFVLTPMLAEKLRWERLMGRADPGYSVFGPIAAGGLVAAVLVTVLPPIRARIRRARARTGETTA